MKSAEKSAWENLTIWLRWLRPQLQIESETNSLKLYTSNLGQYLGFYLKTVKYFSAAQHIPTTPVCHFCPFKEMQLKVLSLTSLMTSIFYAFTKGLMKSETLFMLLQKVDMTERSYHKGCITLWTSNQPLRFILVEVHYWKNDHGILLNVKRRQ